MSRKSLNSHLSRIPTMDPARIVEVSIGPSIGIARLGNSPDAFFVGPESPGLPARPQGGFKDSRGCVKRQAARFRLFGLDSTGQVVAELTAAHGAITWSVHLANAKAAWHEFHGRFHPVTRLRNRDIRNTPAQPNARDALIIDPGKRSICGREVSGAEYRFNSGRYRGVPVALGELRTDAAGRLLVLGGFGRSASTKADNPIRNYANNDYWYDDTSDGPVTAQITLLDGRTLQASAARVIVAPPKFTPDFQNITTLHEIVATASGQKSEQRRVSFARDILPLLRRISRHQWLNQTALRGHGPGKGGDFFQPDTLKQLASAAVDCKPAREAVFSRIRNPNLPLDSQEAIAQANDSFMPQLAGDGGDPINGDPKTWFRMTVKAYAQLAAWAGGDFDADYHPTAESVRLRRTIEISSDEAAPIDELPPAAVPEALTRAALTYCVGAPFYPGIEMTYIAEDPSMYCAPMRLRTDIEPGGITKYMAVPWQADFYECSVHWWPAQRPDDVIPEAAYRKVILKEPPLTGGESAFPSQGVIFPGGSANTDPREVQAERLLYRVAWDRGLQDDFMYADPNIPGGDNAMVDLWSKLGFLAPRPTPTGEIVYVETERDPYVGISIRDCYYYLSNINQFPDFIPKAKELVEFYLAQAWKSQFEPDFPDGWRYFDYSPDAFEERLAQLYSSFVEEAENYDPATDPNFKTREDVLFYLTQTTPFDLNDGAWLRRITPAGPLSSLDSLLFSIWMDEAGDGNVQWNHCNIFKDQIHSVGLYFPESRSREFADNPAFMDSAFVIPTLKLAISQLSDTFFPELLGFTLELEWAAVSNKPIGALMDYYGIPSHFYTLHAGIDNSAAGHGARTRAAIQLYLDDVGRHGGTAAVQAAWKRIWTGFIAFGNCGNMGNDVLNYLRNPPTPADRVAAIITRKQPYGSQNHDENMVGPNRINDWFSDPPGFMDALVKAGYIVKGDPEGSPFFRLTGFTGPMFKVFTDDELATFREWALWLGQDHSQKKVDYAVQMALVIQTLREQQANALEHLSHELKGPDPADPERTRAQSVSAWFAGSNTPEGLLCFMRALANPDNIWIIPGEPDKSPFVTDLLAPSGAMGNAFDTCVPQANNLTRRQIAITWIAQGCPIPKLNTEGKKRRYRIWSPPPAGSIYPPPRIRGMGAVH
ncbi:MAG TPA: LodA/GoxA family CTQ-dependent oxidase [Steroidobacteraceae bacterium]